jgi:ribose 5-phosphate isomerase A
MDQVKKNLGIYASKLIKDNQIIGLGTGSTANFFIQSLSSRVKNGLKIKAIASSIESKNLAKKNNIEIIEPKDIDFIDIYVDGADFVNMKNEMIKGYGAAFVKEKILASYSKEVIIIVDESKLVKDIFKKKIPLEVCLFGKELTKNTLEKLGYIATFRKDKNKELLITENNNCIIDIESHQKIDDINNFNLKLLSMPGVFQTGLFYDLPSKIIIGKIDNTFDIIN